MNIRTAISIQNAQLLVFATFVISQLAACDCANNDCENSSTPSPIITEFSADKTRYAVGEQARLYVSFSGGEGRIEPQIGPVSSSEFFETSTLAETTSYQLIIESPEGITATQELTINVEFRNQWQTLDTTFPVAYHTAITAADGSVLIIGGDRGQSALSADIDRFDPATLTFTKIGELYSGRASHTATRLPSGAILVVGGDVSLSGTPSAELIDENSSEVTDAGNVNHPRKGHTTVLLTNGHVLVLGGTRNTLEIWNPDTKQWRLISARMANERLNPTATLLADGRVLIAGGHSGNPNYIFAEIFDPETESLIQVQPNIEQRRYLHTAHLQSDGGVLIVGGEIAENDIEPQLSVLRFDPQTESFTPMASLNQARTLISAITLPDDRIFLVGGQSESELAIESAGFYSSTGEQDAAPLPDARIWHTVSRMYDGRLLVVGGESDSGQLRSTVLVYE